MEKNFDPKRIGTVLIRLTGLLLLFTAATKGKFIFSGAALLQTIEPVTGLSYGILFIAAVTFEAITGFSALLYPQYKYSALAVAWLATALAGYRAIRHAAGIQSPCKCLGDFLNWWPWGVRHESGISWAIILVTITAATSGYLLCHSAFFTRRLPLTNPNLNQSASTGTV
jgi:hypothetical protein